MSGASEMDPTKWAYDSSNFMTGHIRIPKTYRITKESLTLEDVSLILSMLEISVADNHPLFEQAVKQGLVNVPV